MATGRAGEDAAIAVFETLSPCTTNGGQRNTLSAWDLKFRLYDKDVLVEVKYDLYEARSGNVAVEFWNCRRASPSGITATTADLWAFVLADKSVWVAAVPDLKHAFDTLPKVRDVFGGGDGNADMRLFRRDELFAKCFVRLDGLRHADLLTMLTSLLRLSPLN